VPRLAQGLCACPGEEAMRIVIEILGILAGACRARCPALPGCAVAGCSVDDAHSKMADAEGLHDGVFRQDAILRVTRLGNGVHPLGNLTEPFVGDDETCSRR